LSALTSATDDIAHALAVRAALDAFAVERGKFCYGLYARVV
jgi:hypothetical protein